MGQVMDSDKLNVKCTYADCSKYFETEKAMKVHKLAEPEHNYCKKCNVDCKDWEHLTLHKVAAMQPFLDGKMKDNPDELPKHIVCEFCGMDFKSFGGRKRHREQNHPADQNVVCPGCQSIFTRAGNLVAHLEEDRCKAIRKRDFQASIQQKHAMKQLLEDPHENYEVTNPNQALASTASVPDQIEECRETNDPDEGGVNLLEREEEDQKSGYKPLLAEVAVPLTRSNLETWPRLPGQAPSQLTESMRSMSLRSSTPSATFTDMSASNFASRITSRRGGNKVYTESCPSLSSPHYQASVNDDDDTASESSTMPASVSNRTVAWPTGNTSQSLFKDAKQTSQAGDWSATLNNLVEEASSNHNAKVVKQFDPSSDNFDVALFHNPVIEKYCCPFPACGDTYDEARDMTGHLQLAHKKTSYRCPLCLKLFNSAAALISHAESAGKCKVMKSSKFGTLLTEVSGGFLTAEHVGQKKVYQPKLNEKGEPIEGVMSTRFEAQDARPTIA